LQEGGLTRGLAIRSFRTVKRNSVLAPVILLSNSGVSGEMACFGDGHSQISQGLQSGLQGCQP
jgi:hypothetical protein